MNMMIEQRMEKIDRNSNKTNFSIEILRINFFRGIPKYVYQLYRDSDAKWQHDLYFQDEEVSKSRYPLSKATHRSFE